MKKRYIKDVKLSVHIYSKKRQKRYLLQRSIEGQWKNSKSPDGSYIFFFKARLLIKTWNVNIYYNTLLSYLGIKKISCNSASFHPHKAPRCVVTSVSLSPSERKTCSWREYVWLCLSICIRVLNKPCASKSVWEPAYVFYRNSSLHNWICMSVAWIWVSTLGQVFSMLTMCGLNAESGCNPKWTELVCLTIFAPFFLVPFNKTR